MLFNRINHLFDQMTGTFSNQTLDTWKEMYLNASANGDLSPWLADSIVDDSVNGSDGSLAHMPNASGISSVPPSMVAATSNFSQTNVIHFEPEPLFILILVTVCYSLIFAAGILGNVITCTVISRNKSMHTATNYYLFNLAISDLMLLLSGMPQDTYNIWFPHSYRFSQTICILQGLLSETSTNATVLTIASFTIERYIAICHPFRQHTMSKLSRAVKFILGVWIVAFCFAIPQAIQFGVVPINGGHSCTVQNILVEHAFEISSFLFFVGPMTLICVLYVLIGIKLRSSKALHGIKRGSCEMSRNICGQTRIIRMLIAVAVAFFLCWAPFHAQRLMAVYGKTSRPQSYIFRSIYTALTYISGVLYFMSTCINPLLYSILSHKFRNAFKTTIMMHCCLGGGSDDIKPEHTYSVLSRYNGVGSIKLAGGPHNRRTSNPYIGDVSRIDMVAMQKSPTYIECASIAGQLTSNSNNNSKLPTSNERNDLNGVQMKNIKNSESTRMLVDNRRSGQQQEQQKQQQHQQLQQQQQQRLLDKTKYKAKILNKSIPTIRSSNSIYSMSTISNSSLQEYDDHEMDTTELAKYMRQINNKIRHETM